MSSNISIDSVNLDVFFVEQISIEPSPQRNNSPSFLNSAEISEARTPRMTSVSSIASPEPQIFSINDGSNDPTIPYGFGRQLPIVPPSLNDLNLPPNPFNIFATKAVVNHTEDTNDDNHSPQSPELSELSSISTPPMNVSTFNSWETSHTTTDDKTFYTSDEPRRLYWDISSDDNFVSNKQRNPSVASIPSATPPPPRAQKRKLSIGMSFPKKGECRSTTARHAAKPYELKRHPDAQETLKTLYT